MIPNFQSKCFLRSFQPREFDIYIPSDLGCKASIDEVSAESKTLFSSFVFSLRIIWESVVEGLSSPKIKKVNVSLFNYGFIQDVGRLRVNIFLLFSVY